MKSTHNASRWLLWSIGLVMAVAAAVATRHSWLPPLENLVRSTISSGQGGAAEADPHAGHDHDHAGDSLALSPQARGNIGLTDEYIRPVKLETYRRTIRVPGLVSERPGRTRVQVSTPMAGVITHVHAVQGEAVSAGTLLFQIRITADALISTQTELLKTVGDLEVENREIARLSKATESGAIPQRNLLERQYAKEKLEVLLGAERESLRLLGLSDRQIEDIEKSRKLLSELQILAPHPDEHSDEELKLTGTPLHPASWHQPRAGASQSERPGKSEPPLVLQEVRVHKGQTVAAGETLAVMADYSELYIEGQAFEQDLPLLANAANNGWKVKAVVETAGEQASVLENLDLIYSANEIHADSRTLHFYVRLPNEIVRKVKTEDGATFVQWKHRLGQRLQVLIPVEEWPDRIVLPVDAVAKEGPDSFVFRQNGSRFDRVPVKVDYRDQSSVVLANDGSLFPREIIAFRGAHQMQMALQMQAGGGIDPHAGHTH